MPMDMEWAKDGRTGELFIVQARPETFHSQRQQWSVETFRLTQTGTPLVRGRAVGERVAGGPVRLIKHVDELKSFQNGEVLVADKTDPDWEPTMKKAAAIVTNRGGRTCHAAIVSRELGVPAIVGTIVASEQLKDGQEVTVSCAEGDTGVVYKGRLEFERDEFDVTGLERPETSIMINVANPGESSGFRSCRTTESVWLARSSSSRTRFECIPWLCSTTTAYRPDCQTTN